MKQVLQSASLNHRDYEWYEMGFFTHWTSIGWKVILCFDTPQALQNQVQTALSSPSRILDLSDIYSLHIILVDKIVELFDISVWTLRDLIRAMEMVILQTFR